MEWQPIETAPCEEIIIASIYDGEIDALEWVSGKAQKRHDGTYSFFNLNSGNYLKPSYSAIFTHWMPLPEPPK